MRQQKHSRKRRGMPDRTIASILVLLIAVMLVQSAADGELAFGDNDYIDESNGIGGSSSPTASPGNGNGNGNEKGGSSFIQTTSPTMAPPTTKDSPSPASWIFYTFTIAIVALVAWVVCGYCRTKRELRMLDERSRAADRVLGDMQMIPQDDYDNEII